jgi:opacity protein-like surface antigen
MRLAAVIGASTILSVQLACAADVPQKAPPYPAAPPLIYGWTGFYFGGHFGYGWTNIDDTTSSLTASFPVSTISAE